MSGEVANGFYDYAAHTKLIAIRNGETYVIFRCGLHEEARL